MKSISFFLGKNYKINFYLFQKIIFNSFSIQNLLLFLAKVWAPIIAWWSWIVCRLFWRWVCCVVCLEHTVITLLGFFICGMWTIIIGQRLLIGCLWTVWWNCVCTICLIFDWIYTFRFECVCVLCDNIILWCVECCCANTQTRVTAWGWHAIAWAWWCSNFVWLNALHVSTINKNEMKSGKSLVKLNFLRKIC